jgi:hypothetical protein
MKSMAASIIIMLVMLSSEISSAQKMATPMKIFCPQCGFENKISARFCPQCGSTLPKLTPLNFRQPPPMVTFNQSDSLESARRDFIQALIVDPEFNRLLQQQIQNAKLTTPAAPSTSPAVKSKANPVGAFFTVIGGLTCTLLLLGLVTTL